MKHRDLKAMHFLSVENRWYINLPLQRWEINASIPHGIDIEDVKSYSEDGNSEYHTVMICDMDIVSEDHVDTFFKLLINKSDYEE